MVCKYIFSFVLIFFISCSEIDRDNILDPKNPSSSRDKVLLLEAFVNTNNPFPYNQDVLAAIDVLEMDENLWDKLIVMEYHRNVTNPAYNDIYTLAATENWYEHYTTAYDAESRIKGVPDIFINGAVQRIQGASSSNVVESRVRNISTDLLLEDGEYTVEADVSQNGDEINGKYRIARLGNKSADETVLRIITLYNAESTDTTLYNVGDRTVSYFENHLISSIDAGNYLEEDFQINVNSSKADRLIFVLMDNDMINVLHALEKEIL